jgi:hypothetical protein
MHGGTGIPKPSPKAPLCAFMQEFLKKVTCRWSIVFSLRSMSQIFVALGQLLCQSSKKEKLQFIVRFSRWIEYHGKDKSSLHPSSHFVHRAAFVSGQCKCSER